jgi:hypothetical protein
MRHSSYHTTMKYYTVLGLADTAKAIGQIRITSPATALTPTVPTHIEAQRCT